MTIEQRLTTVKNRIQTACHQANRDEQSVTLLAVSKQHSVASIQAAYNAGQRAFGENYLNEALAKLPAFSEHDIIWHYIGSIQSNKTRKMAEHFAWVHGVDTLRIATRLSNQRPAHLPPLNICLQINIDEQDSKSGISPHYPTLLSLAQSIEELPHVVLRGLMCIPEPKDTQAAAAEAFNRMQNLMHQLSQDGLSLDTLSMGMSDDLDTAIACGATIVRVGTAIFGQRDDSN